MIIDPELAEEILDAFDDTAHRSVHWVAYQSGRRRVPTARFLEHCWLVRQFGEFRPPADIRTTWSRHFVDDMMRALRLRQVETEITV